MKKNRLTIVLCMFFFVVMVSLLIFTSKIDEQTDKMTTFFTATVNEVEITDTGKRKFIKIHTNEYSTALYVSNDIINSINVEDISGLEKGQTIFFGIENTKTDQMNEVEFINITSLKSDKKEIFSLNDYNRFIHDSAYPARIVIIIMAVLFLFTALYYRRRYDK